MGEREEEGEGSEGEKRREYTMYEPQLAGKYARKEAVAKLGIVTDTVLLIEMVPFTAKMEES